MISRKKILSRSQSEVDDPSDYDPYECEDDIWYNKEKLFAVSDQLFFTATLVKLILNSNLISDRCLNLT